MKQTIYIKYENRKYPVIISDAIDEEEKIYGALHIECEAANMNQGVMPEDIWGFLENMGDFIKIAKEIKAEIEKEELEKKTNVLQLRLSDRDKQKIEKKAKENGYKNISAYIRAKALQTA